VASPGELQVESVVAASGGQTSGEESAEEREGGAIEYRRFTLMEA